MTQPVASGTISISRKVSGFMRSHSMMNLAQRAETGQRSESGPKNFSRKVVSMNFKNFTVFFNFSSQHHARGPCLFFLIAQSRGDPLDFSPTRTGTPEKLQQRGAGPLFAFFNNAGRGPYLTSSATRAEAPLRPLQQLFLHSGPS